MKKVLITGSECRLVDGEGISVQDRLPNGVYEIKCNPMTGFYFEKSSVEPFAGKVYGDQKRMTEKVLRRYASVSGRNLGVLLSGAKGTGKSLFVKNLSAVLAKDMPVIVVKSNYGKGMLSVLANVAGRAVVVFDEFEKLFRSDGKGGGSTAEMDVREQEEVLSFFDGVESKQEKLILLTINDVYSMSQYLLGRPGRIHYHFRMQLPTVDEIEEYMKDNVFTAESSAVVSGSGIHDVANVLAGSQVSWDSLSAIALELRMGETVEETVRDLNLTSQERRRREYDFTATFADGTESESFDNAVRNGDNIIRLDFDCTVAKTDGTKADGYHSVTLAFDKFKPQTDGSFKTDDIKSERTFLYNGDESEIRDENRIVSVVARDSNAGHMNRSYAMPLTRSYGDFAAMFAY